MHVKIHDPAKKSTPAVALLLVCSVIIFLARR
jgi:hypothetical protein